MEELTQQQKDFIIKICNLFAKKEISNMIKNEQNSYKVFEYITIQTSFLSEFLETIKYDDINLENILKDLKNLDSLLAEYDIKYKEGLFTIDQLNYVLDVFNQVKENMVSNADNTFDIMVHYISEIKLILVKYLIKNKK